MRNIESVKHKGYLFEVVYKINEVLRGEMDITEYKEKINADIVLRKGGILYFCNIIEDATIEDEFN